MTTLNDVLRRLDQIGSDVDAIKTHLKAVANKDCLVEDRFELLGKYEAWLKQERPNMSSKDRGVRINLVADFLKGADGMISAGTVACYLNDECGGVSKRNLALKTLRPLCRDFLELGKWIERFDFTRVEAAPKTRGVEPGEVWAVADALEAAGAGRVRVAWLLLYYSGLRANEVLGLKPADIQTDGTIDARGAHAGRTKKAGISFAPSELACAHRASQEAEGPLEYKTFHAAVERAKKAAGVTGLTPKDLRRHWADVAREAGLSADMIDVFAGRAPKSVLARHYTTTGTKELRLAWGRVKAFLGKPSPP